MTDETPTSDVQTSALPDAPSHARWWMWAIAVAAIGFVTYLPSLQGDFTLDDVAAVEQDVRLRGPGAVTGAFTRPYLWDVPPSRSPYRPITSVSYALNWAMGGGSPFVFHLFNVLAHVGASLLLLSVLGALGAPLAAAGPAALLFAVHPVHVEAVANIVGRADVLMTLFCLLGVRILLAHGVAFGLRVAGVCLAYLLALGSKENGFVFPVLLLMVQLLFPEGRRDQIPMGFAARVKSAVRSWPMYAALSATLGGYMYLRRSVLGSVAHLDIAAYIAVLPESLRFTTAIANLSEVVRLLLVPADLSSRYGPAVLNPAGPADLRFWGGVATVLAVAALIGIALRSGRPGRWALLGVGWATASFLLVSNLIVPMPMWLAERTLYLPSVGVTCMMVAALLALRARQVTLDSRPVLVGVAVLTLAGSVHTWRYSRAWRTNDTLYADLVERHPESYNAAWWLGNRLVGTGSVERGVTLLEAAVELNPNSVMVTLDLANALLRAGRADDAEERLRPIPTGLHPQVPTFMAQSLILQGRADEARDVVDEGLRLFPDHAPLQSLRAELAGR